MVCVIIVPCDRQLCLKVERESKHMEFQGKRTLIMGLGLNGSGIASARYAAQHGAITRVTDLRPAELLAPSIRSLEGLPIEYVLGQHREEDFLWAEIVILCRGLGSLHLTCESLVSMGR